MNGPEDLDAELAGEVVYLFAFDVAYEVHLDRAAQALGVQPEPVPLGGPHPVPRSLPGVRHLTVERGATLRVNDQTARFFVRVYEVGVISVIVRVGFAKESLAGLAAFHAPTSENGRPLTELAREECAAVCRLIESALGRPGTVSEPEAYTAFYLSAIGGERNANSWLAPRRSAVAGLLTAAPAERLSEAQVAEVLRLQRSYLNTDLVVIDWDAALVVALEEPPDEVLFVLELANLQLEEFRWLDATLDQYLERAYGDLAARRWWFAGTTGVLRSLRAMRVDLARLADEVTHTSKFLGDWHLARVYVLARERFHLAQWRESVDQRLDELDRLYTILRGDIYDRRMFLLEVVIVVFFAIDLIVLFTK